MERKMPHSVGWGVDRIAMMHYLWRGGRCRIDGRSGWGRLCHDHRWRRRRSVMSHIDGRLWLGNGRHQHPRLIRGRGDGGGIATSDHNEYDGQNDDKANKAGESCVKLRRHFAVGG